MNVSEDSIENLKGLKINLQTINEQYRIWTLVEMLFNDIVDKEK